MKWWLWCLGGILARLASADALLLPCDQRPALAELSDYSASFEVRRQRVLDRLESATTRQATLARIRFADIPGVKTIEPLWLVHALRLTGTPEALDEVRRRWHGGAVLRDARTSRRTALDDVPTRSEPLSWNLDRIGAAAIWRRGWRGAGVRIGVLDGGFDRSHPDLGRDDLLGWDFVSNGPLVRSTDGHGTAAAGLAVGKTTGVAPEASLWLGRVCCDADDALFETTVWRGVEAALRANVRVVSMSLGVKAFEGPNYALWRRAGAVVLAADALWIVSAGNRPDDPPGAPAANPPPWTESASAASDAATATIAVGASDEDDVPRPLSTAGLVRWIDIAPYFDFAGGLRKPEVCAPSDVRAPAPNGAYRNFAGTSSATPQAAGLAALLWSIRPDLSAGTIARALRDGALPSGERCGFGRVDALRSLARLPMRLVR